MADDARPGGRSSSVQDELEARRAGFEFLPVAEAFGTLFDSEVSGWQRRE